MTCGQKYFPLGLVTVLGTNLATFRSSSVTECAPKSLVNVSAKRKLVDTRFLNGHVSAPVLEEIAAVMEFSVEDDRGKVGTASNSKRRWMGIMKRETQIPQLYYADVPMAGGMVRHPFRLPSVKARELWQQDKQETVSYYV